MGEVLITRRGCNGIRVKVYEPFTSTSYTSLYGSGYRYNNCDFNGRTFLLFAQLTGNTQYKHFAIIDNGTITEEWDEHEERYDESAITISIEDTSINIEPHKIDANVYDALLIEI